MVYGSRIMNHRYISRYNLNVNYHLNKKLFIVLNDTTLIYMHVKAGVLYHTQVIELL